MPRDFTTINTKGTSLVARIKIQITGKYGLDRESVLTLTGAGLNGVERQVDISGDTHVFDEVDGAGNLINCMVHASYI